MTPERWKQVNEMFHSALEREPAQRPGFLDRACDGDEELRKEVVSLIRSHEQTGSFVDSPAFRAAAQLPAEEKTELTAGQRIGHYKILSLLGSGGMGEVYLAQETRLGRKVALKLLPASFTKDEERVRRFEQEARAASALNHPNILTIFDTEEVDGLHCIAAEYIEGNTLRQQITQTGLSLNEALDVAIQVASALSAAHYAGIVHRDIKPENIILRPDGYVKVLDFGLAKLTERKTVISDTESRAFRAVKTDTGVVMGTAHYMSPEQARGLSVDERTDIFSLGVVIYEMVTGHVPFEGETASHVIVSILEKEPPPLSDYYPEAPAELQRMTSKALSKAKEERYQTINESLIDLKNLRQQLESGAKLERAKKRKVRRGHKSGRIVEGRAFTTKRLIWFATLLLMIGIGGVVLLLGSRLWLRVSRPAPEGESKPASDAPPAALRTVPLTGIPGRALDPSFSPDGSRVAFVSTGEAGDDPDIYVKHVDGGTPQRLTTNPAWDISPVWSPDGNYIAFDRFSEKERAIFTIPAIGGPERKLLSANQAQFPGWGGRIDWSPNGESLAYSDASAPGNPYAIFRLTVETQQARPLTSPPENWPGDTQPVFSPDGQMLAFVRLSSSDVGDIYVVATGGGEPKRLTFDNQLIQGMAWTPDGIVFSSNRGGTPNLWRISAAGGETQPLGVGGDSAICPAISREGQRLAYTKQFTTMSTWRVDLPDTPGKTSSRTKVLSTTTVDEFPQISPDGKRIAFGSRRSGAREIWVCDSDGSNLLKLTNLGRPATGTPRWSPDGQFIAFDTRLDEQADIYVISGNGGLPHRLTEEPADDTMPSWSRDGRSVYFCSNRSGTLQVWKMPADGGDAVQVTKHGGYMAFESPDGKDVYYGKEDLPGLWRVRVEGGEEELVLDRGLGFVHGLWAVADKGIYFAEAEGKTGGVIEFFNFATRRVTRVAAMDRPPGWGLAISPDGRWLLYTQVDVNRMDIILVENFR